MKNWKPFPFVIVGAIALTTANPTTAQTPTSKPNCNLAEQLQRELNHVNSQLGEHGITGKVDFSRQPKKPDKHLGATFRSGKADFTPEEHHTLFALRDRLKNTPGQTAAIRSEDEAKLLSQILSTRVSVGQSLSYKDFNDRVLVPSFQGLAYDLANLTTINHPNAPREDLYQAAMTGLLSALHEYKPESGVKLSTTAYPKMSRAIAQTMSDWNPGASINESEIRAYFRLERLENALQRKLNRAPTDQELIEAYNNPPENIKNRQKSAENQRLRNRTPITQQDIHRFREQSRFMRSFRSLEELTPDERSFLEREKIEVSELRVVKKNFMKELTEFFLPKKDLKGHQYYLEYLGLKFEPSPNGGAPMLVALHERKTTEQIASSHGVTTSAVWSSSDYLGKRLRHRLSGKGHLLNLLTLIEERRLDLANLQLDETLPKLIDTGLYDDF